MYRLLGEIKVGIQVTVISKNKIYILVIKEVNYKHAMLLYNCSNKGGGKLCPKKEINIMIN